MQNRYSVNVHGTYQAQSLATPRGRLPTEWVLEEAGGLDLKESERSSSDPLNPDLGDWILIKVSRGPQARIETDKTGGQRFMELAFMAQGYVFPQDKSAVPSIGAQVSSSAPPLRLLSSSCTSSQDNTVIAPENTAQSITDVWYKRNPY